MQVVSVARACGHGVLAHLSKGHVSLQEEENNKLMCENKKHVVE